MKAVLLLTITMLSGCSTLGISSGSPVSLGCELKGTYGRPLRISLFSLQGPIPADDYLTLEFSMQRPDGRVSKSTQDINRACGSGGLIFSGESCSPFIYERSSLYWWGAAQDVTVDTPGAFILSARSTTSRKIDFKGCKVTFQQPVAVECKIPATIGTASRLKSTRDRIETSLGCQMFSAVYDRPCKGKCEATKATVHYTATASQFEADKLHLTYKFDIRASGRPGLESFKVASGQNVKLRQLTSAHLIAAWPTALGAIQVDFRGKLTRTAAQEFIAAWVNLYPVQY